MQPRGAVHDDLVRAVVAYGFLADTDVDPACLGVVLPTVFLLGLSPRSAWSRPCSKTSWLSGAFSGSTAAWR
jgi:hypothetical protein